MATALHLDALTLVTRLQLLEVCRVAVQLAQHQCPPPLLAGPGGAPRLYREESLLLLALLLTLWRLSYQEVHDWLGAWPTLAWACGLPPGADGQPRVPSKAQQSKRLRAAGAPPSEMLFVLLVRAGLWMGQLPDGLLGDVGYHTLRFSSGVGLLERLQSDGQPCVVLLSLRGPPIASRVILEAVAAGPPLATRHAYIVLTALWDMLPSDYISLLTQLAVPVVPKPFQMEELLDTVAEAAARLER